MISPADLPGLVSARATTLEVAKLLPTVGRACQPVRRGVYPVQVVFSRNPQRPARPLALVLFSLS